MAELNTPVRYISGIGEARAKAMERLGINVLYDLISYFPRGYEDRTVYKSISELQPGDTVCVRAFAATAPVHSFVRRGMEFVKFKAADEAGMLSITFFNQSYVKKLFSVGKSYVFYGKVSGKPGRPEMINPLFEEESRAGHVTGRIMPIYGLTAGLNQGVMQRSVAQGLSECEGKLRDVIPHTVRAEFNLAECGFAYENIHFPRSHEELELARHRLIFEELFVLACAVSRMRRGRVKKSGIKIPPRQPDEFMRLLPFVLTGAQKRAVTEAFSDMSGAQPMNRLVQGDVGSGKTMVAAACCWYCAAGGYQAAFMAPTEILAEQHYKSLGGIFEKLGLKTALLTGSMTKRQKQQLKDSIAAGYTDVVIGTHALLTEDVEFSSLGLVVADEQHRFGVSQRAALSAKGKNPHILVMSATPIPRTLALMIYGELDISVIDELPPGRQKVDTFAVGENMRLRIYNFIRRLVSEGRQVYIVCPMVEENEEIAADLKSVKKYAEHLRDSVFPELRVGLVHGKLKPKEKEMEMDAFSKGEIDILVATTVIEVGVDVPNAALMVVENAERFGLSQLHQLRGRVGRGKYKSYCVLFNGSGSENASDRLKVMCRTCDGFEIAEEDLKLRGPGDFFGSRQHGLPEMKIAGLVSDMNVLKEAQTAAEKVLERDPELKSPENESLREHIEYMLKKNTATFN